jgi:HD superfamily phosphodiesterase
MRRKKLLAAVLAEARKAFALNTAWTQHGPSHWLQVEKNAIMLAEQTPDCDMEVARLFALLHDCKRQNEGSDPEHGARAAAFAQNCMTGECWAWIPGSWRLSSSPWPITMAGR